MKKVMTILLRRSHYRILKKNWNSLNLKANLITLKLKTNRIQKKTAVVTLKTNRLTMTRGLLPKICLTLNVLQAALSPSLLRLQSVV